MSDEDLTSPRLQRLESRLERQNQKVGLVLNDGPAAQKDSNQEQEQNADFKRPDIGDIFSPVTVVRRKTTLKLQVNQQESNIPQNQNLWVSGETLDMQESESERARPPSATLASMEAELENFRVSGLAALKIVPVEESKDGHKMRHFGKGKQQKFKKNKKVKQIRLYYQNLNKNEARNRMMSPKEASNAMVLNFKELSKAMGKSEDGDSGRESCTKNESLQNSSSDEENLAQGGHHFMASFVKSDRDNTPTSQDSSLIPKNGPLINKRTFHRRRYTQQQGRANQGGTKIKPKNSNFSQPRSSTIQSSSNQQFTMVGRSSKLTAALAVQNLIGQSGRKNSQFESVGGKTNQNQSLRKNGSSALHSTRMAIRNNSLAMQPSSNAQHNNFLKTNTFLKISQKQVSAQPQWQNQQQQLQNKKKQTATKAVGAIEYGTRQVSTQMQTKKSWLPSQSGADDADMAEKLHSGLIIGQRPKLTDQATDMQNHSKQPTITPLNLTGKTQQQQPRITRQELPLNHATHDSILETQTIGNAPTPQGPGLNQLIFSSNLTSESAYKQQTDDTRIEVVRRISDFMTELQAKPLIYENSSANTDQQLQQKQSCEQQKATSPIAVSSQVVRKTKLSLMVANKIQQSSKEPSNSIPSHSVADSRRTTSLRVEDQKRQSTSTMGDNDNKGAVDTGNNVGHINSIDSQNTTPRKVAIMAKMFNELVTADDQGETSKSIVVSEVKKQDGQAEDLFEKFQTLQDKQIQNEQMIKLAKKKKTAFAKAVLVSASSGQDISPIFDSSALMNKDIGGESGIIDFINSERILTTAEGTREAFSRANAVNSIQNLVLNLESSDILASDVKQDGRFIASPAELKRAQSRPNYQRNQSASGFSGSMLTTKNANRSKNYRSRTRQQRTGTAVRQRPLVSTNDINFLSHLQSQDGEQKLQIGSDAKGVLIQNKRPSNLRSNLYSTVDLPVSSQRQKSTQRTTEQRISNYQNRKTNNGKSSLNTIKNAEEIIEQRRQVSRYLSPSDMQSYVLSSPLSSQNQSSAAIGAFAASPNNTRVDQIKSSQLPPNGESQESKMQPNTHMRVPNFLKRHLQQPVVQEIDQIQDDESLLDYQRKQFNLTELLNEKVKEPIRMFKKVSEQPKVKLQKPKTSQNNRRQIVNRDIIQVDVKTTTNRIISINLPEKDATARSEVNKINETAPSKSTTSQNDIIQAESKAESRNVSEMVEESKQREKQLSTNQDESLNTNSSILVSQPASSGADLRQQAKQQNIEQKPMPIKQFLQTQPYVDSALQMHSDNTQEGVHSNSKESEQKQSRPVTSQTKKGKWLNLVEEDSVYLLEASFAPKDDLKVKRKLAGPIPCIKGKIDPQVALQDRELFARVGGQEIPIQVDKPPETEFNKLIHKLNTTYDWDKVAKINLAKTYDQNFLETLHAVDANQIAMITEPKKKQLLSHEQQNSKAQNSIPELKNLMQDSMIDLANLSEIETPRAKTTKDQEEDMHIKAFEKKILLEYEEMKQAQAKLSSNLIIQQPEEIQSNKAQSQSEQIPQNNTIIQVSKVVQESQYAHMQVKNPLFRFKERPNVLDVLYQDCIQSYADKKDVNIYTSKPEEFLNQTLPATKEQNTSYDVKVIFDKMDKEEQNGDSQSILIQDKETIIKELEAISERNTTINTYNASVGSEIGQLKVMGSQCFTQNEEETICTKSMHSSVDSTQLNEMRKDFKDLHCKRLYLNLSEADSLQQVTVKLLIDFEKFIDLQHKLPDEYTASNRLATTISLKYFDDYSDEASVLHRVIVSRRKANLRPLLCDMVRKDKISGKKITVRGKVIDYDQSEQKFLVQEANEQAERYYTIRMNLVLLDFETKKDMDQRKVMEIDLQKQSFLRANIERMFFSQILKLRPEIRPTPAITNKILELVNLKRIEHLNQKPIDPNLVQKVARQAEAVYTHAMIKNLCLTEIEEENPRFTQFVKGFKVQHNELMRQKFYSLQAFEKNNGPIDHLISKKAAIEITKSQALISKTHFYECQKFINQAKLEIMDQTHLFEFPLSEEIARIMMVNKILKRYKFKTPQDLINQIQSYPLNNLVFCKAYKALADSFQLHILSKWHHQIEINVKQMVKKHYGGLKNFEHLTNLDQISPKLQRFYNCVNQIMVSQLFEKFKNELTKFLKWLLGFGRRLPGWITSKPYQMHRLDRFQVKLSPKPLVIIEISIAKAIVNNKVESEVASSSSEQTDLVSSAATIVQQAKKRQNFRQQLKSLKPKIVPHAIESKPMIEKIFFGLFQMINESCLQFHQVKKIEHTLYKRLKFNPLTTLPYLKVSPASCDKDTKSMYDERGMPIDSQSATLSFISFKSNTGRENSKYDEILKLREAIEFVVKDELDMVEDQVQKLNLWVRYSGMTFEDIIFELKRLKFQSNLQSSQCVADEEEDEDAEFEQRQFSKPKNEQINEKRPSSADQKQKIRNQIEIQEISEAEYKVKYEELKDAYWQAHMEIKAQYDFGMIIVDCNKFKQQVLDSIDKLKIQMENLIKSQFQKTLQAQVQKNEIMWTKVTSNHTDIDEIIVQIDYLHSIQDEEIFENMRTLVTKIGKKKTFLDSMYIAISEEDFDAFMKLYSFPNELKHKLVLKQYTLLKEQVHIFEQINEAAADVKGRVEDFNLEFIQFQDIGMMTLQELKQMATATDKEDIDKIIEYEQDDNPNEKLFWDKDHIAKWSKVMKELQKKLVKADSDIDTIIRRQMQLGFPLSTFPEIDILKKEMKPLIFLWDTIQEFDRVIENWKNSPIYILCIDEIDEFCNEWARKLINCQRDEMLKDFDGPMQYCGYILRQVEVVQTFIPLLALLKGRGMLQAHFDMINKEFGGIDIQMRETNFKWLSKQDLHYGKQLEFIKQISDLASKEYTIKTTIDQIEYDLSLCIIKPIEFQGSYLLADIDSDTLTIKECQLKTNSISSSSYARRYRDVIDQLIKNLKNLIKFYSLWKNVQKLWAYMTPIFQVSDLSEQMPRQYKLFYKIDKLYRASVARLELQKRLTYRDFHKYEGSKDSVQAMFNQLETLMKSLTKYIEEKREKFPRFYFLSNEQIIEMTGTIQDVESLESNFHKMFEGIDRLIIMYREHQMTLSQRIALKSRIDKELEKDHELKKIQKQKTSVITKQLTMRERIDKGMKEIQEIEKEKLLQKAKEEAQQRQELAYVQHQSDEIGGQKYQPYYANKKKSINLDENLDENLEPASKEQLFQNALIDAQSVRRQKRLDPEDMGQIWGVVNTAGEYIRLNEPIQVTQNVEQWMLKLEMYLKHAVSQKIYDCYHDVVTTGEEFKTWITKWPTQFVLLVLEITFSQRLLQVFPANDQIIQHLMTHKIRVTQNVSKSKQMEIMNRKASKVKDNSLKALKTVLDNIHSQIGELTKMILNQLSVGRRITLHSLIINRVHHRDIVMNMLESGIEQTTDFLFKVQIKFFIEDHGPPANLNLSQRVEEYISDIEMARQLHILSQSNIQPDRRFKQQIDLKPVAELHRIKHLKQDQLDQSIFPAIIKAKMLNAELPYGYEFLKNSSRLVITPLTEKVFQSLFMALHFQYGGAPIGPVGTGKTESIKELSKMTARHCYVFNCQSSIDIDSMTKFFKGLSANGSWVCFDEFNRLEINILSIISQHIIVIQRAKRQMDKFITIDGTVLNFKQVCAPFITMNPFFVGRTPLPDNLKALFRHITMVIPNTMIIAEIILYSNGFLDAQNLAYKVYRLFSLLNEQLKYCAHYDFGLRAIKCILVSAGKMKLRAICVQTDEELAMKKADNAIHEHMMTVNRIYKEKQTHSGIRGNDQFQRQTQLRKKKSRHNRNLVEEEEEDAADFRINYDKIKQTFLTRNDPDNSSIEGVQKISDGSTSEVITELSDCDEDYILPQKKGQLGQQPTSKSELDGSKANKKPEKVQLNLAYLHNDLGCTNIKIRRDPKLLDQFILLKSIIDGSLPKLLFMDIKIFQNICYDIFPEIEAPQLSNRFKFREVVEEKLDEINCLVNDEIVQNVLNLHQAVQSRHGIMCIGPSMSGKSTAIKILGTALKAMHQLEFKEMVLLFSQKKADAQDINTQMVNGELKTVLNDPLLQSKIMLLPEETQLVTDICTFKGIENYIINPKAVTIHELMGNFDETSREWVDGLLANAIRKSVNEQTGKEMLVTFDGPVEPDWVENINSVLDDNKRLNLVTGEIIYLTEHVKVFLETADLTNCSPATVSRCAIIYFPQEHLPVKAHFNSWLSSLPKILYDQRARLDDYFNYFMPTILSEFMNPENLIYKISDHWAIKTFTMIFDSLIVDYRTAKYLDLIQMEKITTKLNIVKRIEKQAKISKTVSKHKFNRQNSIIAIHQIEEEIENVVERQISLSPNNKNKAQNYVRDQKALSSAQVKVNPPDYRWVDEIALLENSIRYKDLWMDSFFLYALTWAFGSILIPSQKKKFDQWMKNCLDEKVTAQIEKSRVDLELEKQELLDWVKYHDEEEAKKQSQLAGPESPSPLPLGISEVKNIAMATIDENIDRINTTFGIERQSTLNKKSSKQNLAIGVYIPSALLEQGSLIKMITEIPREVNIFDLFFDVASNSWQSWKSVLFQQADSKNVVRPKDIHSNELLQQIVLTQDFLRMEFLLQRHFHAKIPLLLMGSPGIGKTTMLRHYMKTQDNSSKISNIDLVSCCHALNAKRTQTYLEQRMVPVSRSLLQPDHGKHIIFVFDDINMQQKDKWGHISSNELIRQFLNYQGWYKTQTCHFRKVKEINFAATFSIRSEKNEMDERLGWKFATIGYHNFTGCHIEHIYSRILTTYFSKVSGKRIQANAPFMLIRASLGLLQMMENFIQPSPMKFLYEINQRHLLFLLKGFIDAPTTYFQDFKEVGIMWIHEVVRVVLDRFSDENEKERLFTEVQRLAFEVFKLRPQENPIKLDHVYFTYGLPDGQQDDYRPIPAQESVIQKVMEDALQEFNELNQGKTQLDVVFFNSVIEKVIKINRSLRTVGGNTILVAHEGCGSFELVKIAIKISDWEDCVMYEKDSDLEEDWRLQIKDLMCRIANNGKVRHVLHVEERDISSVGLLEALDAIAAHNETFLYFTKEEQDSMVSSLRQQIGPILVRDCTDAQILDMIRQDIRDSLTMLIQLAPRSNVFTTQLRETFHLVNSSTIIQFGDWNRAGLKYMAEKYFQNNDSLLMKVEEGKDDDVHVEHLDKVVICQIDMHHDCEKATKEYYHDTGHLVYVSPQHFENFIRTYKRLLKVRNDELQQHQQRFLKGFQGIRKCLRETEDKQEELSKKAPLLVARQIELEATLDNFRERQAQIHQEKDLRIQREVQVNVEYIEAFQIQQTCDKNFKKITPQFIKANEDLHKINRVQIDEIMTIKEPSETLQKLGEAVCIIMQVPPKEVRTQENNYILELSYWQALKSQKLLGNFRILEILCNIDPTSISEDIMQKLQTLLKRDELSLAKVRHSSEACNGLYNWIKAVQTYYFIYHDAAPIRDKLIKADLQLNKIKAKKQQITDQIKEIEQELKKMCLEQKIREDEIAEFQKEIDICYFTRSRASKLLNELTGEMQKWRISEEVARVNIRVLEGDCLMAAAMVCYLSPFTQKIRQKLFNRWLNKVKDAGIRLAPDMNFNNTFADKIVLKSWLHNGLPNDSYSIENAIILELSQFQPILIDPQAQANSWLRKQIPDVKILNIHTTRFMVELKHYIKFGYTVIIENMGDQIPRKLYPIFSYTKMKTLNKYSPNSIYIDKQMQPIDNNFRLYITSMMSNPDFGSELSLMASFVNFNVTIEAFEAQILSLLLEVQEHELDHVQKLHRRQALTWFEQLKDIEDVIIHEVTKDQPVKMMIDAGILTDKLIQSRIMGKSIGKSLIEIKNAMTVLMRQSKIYKSLSVRAAKFFYMINDLKKLNSMYQFTHEWFMDFFRGLLKKFRWGEYLTTNKKKEQGMKKLTKKMTKNLFNLVAQSLVQKDILLFAFLLAYQELDSELKCDMRQVEFFIKGNLAPESEIFNKNAKEMAEYKHKKQEQTKEKSEHRKQIAPWLSNKQWAAIDRLSTIPPFNQPNRQNMDANLANHVENNPQLWFNYVNDKEFLEMATNNANNAEEQKQKEKKIQFRKKVTIQKRETLSQNLTPEKTSAIKNNEEQKNRKLSMKIPVKIPGAQNSSSSDFDSEEYKEELSNDEGHDQAQIDLERRQKQRALIAQMTLKKLERCDTNLVMSKGIPGNYEEFSYQEAKKIVEDIRRTEQFVMQKLRLGLAKRVLTQAAQEAIVHELEKKEFDAIFSLDLQDLRQDSDNMLGSEQLTNSLDHHLEDVEEGYESFRKNNEAEDERIAETIIQGVAEYTEFKVHHKRKHSMKKVEKQFNLDKDLVRLCIMRCFHPDKLMQEICSFIVRFLGKYFVEIPAFNFQEYLATTNKKVPVLFMVGSNVNCLQEMHQMMQNNEKFVGVQIEYQPMGSVEFDRIAKMIIRAACKGTWLLLDNLQLSLEIIPNLTKFLESMYACEAQCKEQIQSQMKAQMDQVRAKRSFMVVSNDINFAQEARDKQMYELDEHERKQFKFLCRNEKRMAREIALGTIETNERAQSQAEMKNETRQLTDEEACLKDFIFPETLTFPVHSKFRLFLSSFPVENFPQDFSRRCSKISLELPTAIRPNTSKSLQNLKEGQFESLPNHAEGFKKLVFSMTVMHAVINQRERYGSFGWSQPYLFSPNDLQISIQTLEEVCGSTAEKFQLPIQLIQYLVGELNYGGRIINQEDRDILQETVKHFLNQDVIDQSGLVPAGVQVKHFQMIKAKELYNLASQKLQSDNAIKTMQIPRNYLMPVMIDNKQSMLQHVRDFFPIDDAPEIFGLHKSAITQSTMELAKDIMDRTYKHQFVIKRSTSHKSVSKHKVNAHLQQIFEYYRQKLIDIQLEIPEAIPKRQYEKELPIRRNAPFSTFLVKEIQKYNVLLEQIKENLALTRAALEGHRQHDEFTLDTFECLQTEKVPTLWIKYSYPCHVNLITYIENLKQRMRYISELKSEFKQKTCNIRRFWMPGFFNQKNFLNTLLSIVSRQDNIAMEKLQIKYQILSDTQDIARSMFKQKNATTFFVDGLWIYGAKWDEQKETICDLGPIDQTGNIIPVMKLDIVEFNPLAKLQLDGQKVDKDVREERKYVGGSTDSFGTDTESINSKEDGENSEISKRLTNAQARKKGSQESDTFSSEDQDVVIVGKDQFECPMYVNFLKNRCLNMFESESQLIAMVTIPSKLHPPKFWIQRGVCLLCYSESLEDK